MFTFSPPTPPSFSIFNLNFREKITMNLLFITCVCLCVFVCVWNISTRKIPLNRTEQNFFSPIRIPIDINLNWWIINNWCAWFSNVHPHTHRHSKTNRIIIIDQNHRIPKKKQNEKNSYESKKIYRKNIQQQRIFLLVLYIGIGARNPKQQNKNKLKNGDVW